MLPVVLGIILALLLYFSESFFENIHLKQHKKFTSFAAGVSVAYLFMQLLPEFTSKAWIHHRALFVAVLLGFSLYHLTEKYLYKHHAKQAQFRNFHSAFTIFYHFALGTVLYDATAFGLLPSLVFFIPVSLHLSMSSIVEHHIHEDLAAKMKEKTSSKILFAIVPLFGVLVASSLANAMMLKLCLMGMFAGSMFFIVIREAIPRDEKGEPTYFALGAGLFTGILFVLWSLFPII